MKGEAGAPRRQTPNISHDYFCNYTDYQQLVVRTGGKKLVVNVTVHKKTRHSAHILDIEILILRHVACSSLHIVVKAVVPHLFGIPNSNCGKVHVNSLGDGMDWRFHASIHISSLAYRLFHTL